MYLAAALAVALVATAIVVEPWSAEAAPGDDDATFFPVAPCRLFDFRPGQDPAEGKKSPLGAGESNVHTQQVTGTVGDCTVPSDATGVAMNVTIVNPTADSNLRIFPADVDVPNASNLNWQAGQAATPNKVDVKLSTDGKIKLFNQSGTVNVLADVVGYYSGSTLEELASTVGQPGPAGPAGPAGPSHAYATTTAITTSVSPTATTVDVMSLSLPAGSYVIQAKLYGVAAGDDPGRKNLLCSLVTDETQLDYNNSTADSGDYANSTLLGTIELAAPDDVVVQCRSDFASGTFSLYGYSMVATQVGALN